MLKDQDILPGMVRLVLSRRSLGHRNQMVIYSGEPFDLRGKGRMATLQDPQGAVLSVWVGTGAFTGIGKQDGSEERESWIVLFTTEIGLELGLCQGGVLDAKVTVIRPKQQRISKMAYGIGSDGIPFVLIQV